MSNNAAVSLVVENKVATVTIERAEALNALNEEVLKGLLSTMQGLRQRCTAAGGYQELRAVVLRGSGEKAFVAGADIKAMHRASAAQRAEFIELGQRAMRAVEETPLPVVAVVQGFALGGGLELVLAADIVVSSTRAKFGQPEVNLGLIPGFGGTQRLPLRIGTGRARRLIFTGETIAAAEAHAIGLVDYLAEAEKLEETVQSVLSTLIAKSPLAIAAAKRSIAALHADNLDRGLASEVAEFLQAIASDDADEGLTAFSEKRPPVFPGK